ncbi:hypothetical protein KSP39_PZI012812 [Platanthera zijinensis]|uniref:Uncharacterized protein n=1 Tax=Platanthera zijinensis TaxID=2320716 RepID=A0AAP0G4G1_9ASPA
MAVLPSAANLLGANLRAHLLPNAIPICRIFFASEHKKPIIRNLHTILSRVCCSNLKQNTVETLSKDDTELSDGAQWVILKPWDVPWDWKVTTFVMMPYIMSIFLTGIVESARQQGAPGSYMENMFVQLNNTDELAIKIFMDQLLKSMAKLLVLYIFVRPHQPFPEDIFSLDWGSPFNATNGWILWAVGGLSIACLVAFLIKVLISGLYAGHADNGYYLRTRHCGNLGSSLRRSALSWFSVSFIDKMALSLPSIFFILKFDMLNFNFNQCLI